MEPRFERRKKELLADCQVQPALFRGVRSRLETFAQPFVAAMPSPESQHHSRTYLAGLFSDLERKNAEAIASRYDLEPPDHPAVPQRGALKGCTKRQDYAGSRRRSIK